MSKLMPLIDDGIEYGRQFYCPGCKCNHGIPTVAPNPMHPNGSMVKWDFNGDEEKPTFSPSIRVSCKYPDHEDICHSFVRDGKIEFLSDCTHELAGQTIDMIDIEDT